MTLIRILIPAGSPQLHHSCRIWVIYKLVELSAVPQVRSGIDLCENIFGASYKAEEFQNNHLKTITQSEFHFQPRMPLSSAASAEKNILLTHPHGMS